MRSLMLLALLAAPPAWAEPGARAAAAEEVAPAPLLPPGALDALPLPPPPSPGSALDEADLAEVLTLQASRTAEDCARGAALDRWLAPEALWGEVSPFATPTPPDVAAHLARVDAEASAWARALKGRYERARPYAAHPAVIPCVPARPSPSYPSGHALLARVFAHALADLAPARRDELLARAEAIGRDRVLVGVHYPSDVRAGVAAADALHELLLASPEYRRAVEALRVVP